MEKALEKWAQLYRRKERKQSFKKWDVKRKIRNWERILNGDDKKKEENIVDFTHFHEQLKAEETNGDQKVWLIMNQNERSNFKEKLCKQLSKRKKNNLIHEYASPGIGYFPNNDLQPTSYAKNRKKSRLSKIGEVVHMESGVHDQLSNIGDTELQNLSGLIVPNSQPFDGLHETCGYENSQSLSSNRQRKHLSEGALKILRKYFGDTCKEEKLAGFVEAIEKQVLHDHKQINKNFKANAHPNRLKSRLNGSDPSLNSTFCSIDSVDFLAHEKLKDKRGGLDLKTEYKEGILKRRMVVIEEMKELLHINPCSTDRHFKQCVELLLYMQKNKDL